MLFDFIKRFWFINPSTGFFIGGGSSAARYQITNSVRLRAAASAYFQRTAAVSATATKATTSFWLKREALTASLPTLFGSASGFVFQLAGASGAVADTIRCYGSAGLGSTTEYISTDVFRDPAAWYHFCVIFDTTAAAADRLQVWVNNRRVAQANANYPTASGNINWQTTAQVQYIGTYGGAGYADGYFADFYHVGEQVKAATDFGEYNSDGVWVPKRYAGTYGTNGFHLDFKDAALTAGSNAGLGKDVSGNGNYWTTNNISVTAGVTYDSMVDTPTNNYATLSALFPTAGTISSAGLGASYPTAANTIVAATSPVPASSLIYIEVTPAHTMSGANNFGVCLIPQTTPKDSYWNATGFYGFDSQGATTFIVTNGSRGSTLGTGFAAGECMQLAINTVSGKAWLGRNNTWFNSTAGTNGNPTADTNPTFTVDFTNYLIGVFMYSVSTAAAINFGQRPFTYTPPTNFKAFCTANLPAVAITNPKLHFDTNTRTGTAATYNVTGKLFKPDFAWIKARNNTQDHILYDSVRGATKRLYSSTTVVEDTDPNGLQSFNSDGFTHGSGSGNTSTYTYIDWLWKAGGAPVANNVGTISANPTAGFSICAWSHTSGSADTVNHGLGETPDMLIWKERNASANNWFVQHKGLSGGVVGGRCLYLNSSGADAANYAFSAANSTSVTFIAGSGTATMVMYAFKEKAGFSKFGNVIANNSSNGPFVHCGFRPRFIMWKNVTGTGGWVIYDSARDTYNACNAGVEANLSGNEQATWGPIDILSNGFKFRAAVNADTNYSNYTYVFAAFAEHPFGGSNVAPSPAR